MLEAHSSTRTVDLGICACSWKMQYVLSCDMSGLKVIFVNTKKPY